MTDVLAAIVRAEPDWDALAAKVSPGLVGITKRCLRKNPRDMQATLNCAGLYLEKGDARRALEFYDSAVGLGSEALECQRIQLADALSSRASAWTALGRPDRGKADLKKALLLAPASWSRRSETKRLLRNKQRPHSA